MSVNPTRGSAADCATIGRLPIVRNVNGRAWFFFLSSFLNSLFFIIFSKLNNKLVLVFVIFLGKVVFLRLLNFRSCLRALIFLCHNNTSFYLAFSAPFPFQRNPRERLFAAVKPLYARPAWRAIPEKFLSARTEGLLLST